MTYLRFPENSSGIVAHKKQKTNFSLSCNQYYYAHNTLNFSTEGAKHFKGDGKIYGGEPVLIKTTSTIEKEQKLAQIAAEAKPKSKAIAKFSWCDEETKVKIYIDTN